MLSCLLTNDELNKTYELSFSYRYTVAYEQGLRARINSPIKEIPLNLPDTGPLYSLIDRVAKNRLLTKILKGIAELLLLRYFFVVYDIGRLYLLLHKEKPNILQINNGGYPGAYSCLAAAIAARMVNIKGVIFVVNNIATPYNTLLRCLDRPIDRFVAKYTTLFITGSSYAKLQLCEVLRLPEDKAVNIPNTIMRRSIIKSKEDIMKRLSFNEDDVILGNVALLERRKGHKYLIEAFATLKNNYRQFGKVKLVIEGSGREEKRLKRLVKQYGIEKNVLFLSNEKNIFDILNIFDIFVLSSIEKEDFPNVTLEAMSLGKPVIGTRLAGMSEQIESGVNGFIVAPRDIDALSDAMLVLIKDKKKRIQMGEKSLERFNNFFSYDKIISNYINLYEDIMKHYNKQGGKTRN